MREGRRALVKWGGPASGMMRLVETGACVGPAGPVAMCDGVVLAASLMLVCLMVGCLAHNTHVSV